MFTYSKEHRIFIKLALTGVLSLCLSQGLSTTTLHSAFANVRQDKTASASNADKSDPVSSRKDIKLSLEPETVTADVDLPDNDALFSNYIESIFYQDSLTLPAAYAIAGENNLSAETYRLYKALAKEAQKVASGQQSSTEFTYTPSRTSFTWKELTENTSPERPVNPLEYLGVDSNERYKLLHALLIDNPYHFYWFDKTDGGMVTRYNFNKTEDGVKDFKVIFSFTAAPAYRGSSGVYSVSSSKVKAAQAAAKAASSVVSQNASKSDYEKLAAYNDYICRNTDYNRDALTANTDYGDPWQLIYVFDGDVSTKVVCEGYAKAFQYLCDLSSFSDAECYSVSGVLNSGIGHMWNIVRIGGQNYLVDVTNNDSHYSYAGNYQYLFLRGGLGTPASGYSIQNIKYTYYNEMLQLYGQNDNSVLKISGTDYTLRRCGRRLPLR